MRLGCPTVGPPWLVCRAAACLHNRYALPEAEPTE